MSQLLNLLLMANRGGPPAEKNILSGMMQQEFGKCGGKRKYKDSGIGLPLLSSIDALEWRN